MDAGLRMACISAQQGLYGCFGVGLGLFTLWNPCWIAMGHEAVRGPSRRWRSAARAR